MWERIDFLVVVGIDHHAWWSVMYAYLYTAKHVGYFGLSDNAKNPQVQHLLMYCISFHTPGR